MFITIERRLVVALSLCVILLSSQVFAGDEWRQLTAAELQMKKPTVEADADAEVIFWEIRVDDSTEDLVEKHYIRVKIFTEKGREKYSKVDIPYLKGIKISGIEARVIKPDGSIVELTKNEIFEREIAKASGIKVKAKSFAIPNIETGVIVEYRYKETYSNGIAEDMRMYFQHDVPIQNITYYFKPAASGKVLSFNMNESKFVKDKGGFYRATVENVPAIVKEPYMPPEDEIRAWSIIYYESNRKSSSTDFWARAGGYVAYKYDIKDALKPDKDIKAAAAEITAGASTPEEQIAKIYLFCKMKVKNITYSTDLTDEQKEKIKPNKSPSSTYKRLEGTDDEINQLFASLADAAGLETRFAFGGNRSEKFFNVREAHESFIHFSGIGINLNGRWRYYDPGSYFTPFGMLEWFEEDTDVLLLNYKNFITTVTTFSDHNKTLAKRTAKLKLSEDGTLEGDVNIEYTGHLAYKYKMENYDDSQNQREETLKQSVQESLSTAEISGIKIENVQDPEKPFIYSYKIRIPNYAQKTGKRLFLQPGFFEYNAKPLFSAATRKYAVFFPFPWSEQDKVEITLPQGFELDNADAPAALADSQKISSLDINIQLDKSNNLLTYNRKFHFGGGGNTLFRTEAYPAVKALFDAFNKANTHTITLKQN